MVLASLGCAALVSWPNELMSYKCSAWHPCAWWEGETRWSLVIQPSNPSLSMTLWLLEIVKWILTSGFAICSMMYRMLHWLWRLWIKLSVWLFILIFLAYKVLLCFIWMIRLFWPNSLQQNNSRQLKMVLKPETHSWTITETLSETPHDFLVSLSWH